MMIYSSYKERNEYVNALSHARALGSCAPYSTRVRPDAAEDPPDALASDKKVRLIETAGRCGRNPCARPGCCAFVASSGRVENRRLGVFLQTVSLQTRRRCRTAMRRQTEYLDGYRWDCCLMRCWHRAPALRRGRAEFEVQTEPPRPNCSSQTSRAKLGISRRMAGARKYPFPSLPFAPRLPQSTGRSSWRRRWASSRAQTAVGSVPAPAR